MESEISTTEIPSHQPDFPVPRSSENLANAGLLMETGPSSHNQLPSFHSPQDSTAQSSGNASGEGGLPRFLTQTNLDSDVVPPTSQVAPVPDHSANTSSREQRSGVHSSEENLSQDLTSVRTASSQSTSQAAQVVVPLSSGYHDLVTQSQAELAVTDEESVVPDTLPGPPQTHQHSQNSSRGLSELDVRSTIAPSILSDDEPESQAVPVRVDSEHIQFNRPSDDLEAEGSFTKKSPSAALVRPTNSLDYLVQHTVPQPSQKSAVTPTKMDGVQQSDTPMSTAEKLRRIRERNFAKLAANPEAIDPPALAAPSDTRDESKIDAHADTPAVSSTHSPTDASVVPSADTQAAQIPEAPSPIVSPSFLIPSFDTDRSEQPSIGQPSDFETHQVPVKPVHSSELIQEIDPGQVNYNISHQEPATLNPSSLTLSIEQDTDISPSVPTDDAFGVSLPVPHEFDSGENDVVPPDYPRNILPYIAIAPNEYLITLPLQNSVRPQYNDVLRENKALMDEYIGSFRVLPHQTPDPTTVSRVDEMFSRLFDICDLPPFLETVSSLVPDDMTKHVIGTNAKFAFVDELLANLAESDKKILILARPPVINFLRNLVQTRGYRYIESGVVIVDASAARHPLTVAVSSTADGPDQVPKDDFDGVIAFDHTFRHNLLPSLDYPHLPVVMVLVGTATIQHLNMRVSENMDPLERKCVLNLTLIKAMRFVEEQDFPITLLGIADLFARHIDMPEDDEFYWDPQEIPEYVFEDLPAANSQEYPSHPSMQGYSGDPVPSSRKRSHVSELTRLLYS
ncbi:hypothetical protein F5B20DRAFT_338923 [Whalleya microplaca]|nr:hypothetical protein F5B20DRAFT_338923 [Whalleya microplaca]